MDRFDIHLKAIEHWGKELQINKAIEEMNELIFELNKFLTTKGDRRKIIREMADVLNTLEQQCLIHNIDPNEIAAEQDRKMERIKLDDFNEWCKENNINYEVKKMEKEAK